MEDPIFPIPKLPNDLIIEILTWVPVKPLLKFRSVCISSQHFVRAHLEHSKLDPNFSPQRLIMTCQGNFKQCSVNAVLYEPVSEAFDLSLIESGRGWVVGSCNGLICLVGISEIILWNPSTRIWKKLPDSGVEIYRSYYNHGLGFDKSSDDYKVVGYFLNKLDMSEVIVQVYSLRNDEWKRKRIKNFAKNDCGKDEAAKFANGKLYWIFYQSSASESRWDIFSFDLEKEEAEVLQMPSYVKHGNSGRLGVSGGSLLVLCNHLTSADVWIMDCCNVGNKIWTKVVTIPHFNDDPYDTFETILYVKHGRILLVFGDTLAIFDAKDCSISLPDVRTNGAWFFLDSYLESLVSPLG